MTPRGVPCAGMNPCAVPGCACKVARFAPRAARTRICECCFLRLQPDERALLAKETQKDKTVVAVLGLLAGELAIEREDEADRLRAEAANASPFLDELGAEVAAKVRGQIASAAPTSDVVRLCEEKIALARIRAERDRERERADQRSAMTPRQRDGRS
jgi:hypothetical protein